MLSSIITGLGLLVVFIVIFCTIVAIRKKMSSGITEHYDERQMIVRGKAFKLGCMVTIALNMIYGLFLYGLTKEFVAPQFVVIAIAMIGIVAYSVYCIFKDAYVQVGANIKSFLIIDILVVLCNAFSAFINRGQGITYEGFATSFSLNLLLAITFGIVLVALVAKTVIDKKEECL
jgi:hypothetical protein